MIYERIGNLDALNGEINCLMDNLNAIAHFAEEDGAVNYSITVNSIFSVVFALNRILKELDIEVTALAAEKYTQKEGNQ